MVLDSATVYAINAAVKSARHRIWQRIKALPGTPSSARVYYNERQGLAYSIGIRFLRHGVYVEKGAGRGRGGTKGSRWIGPDGSRRSTNPASLGKMGKFGRKAKPWLNPVLLDEHPKLANELGRVTAEASIRDVKRWLIQ